MGESVAGPGHRSHRRNGPATGPTGARSGPPSHGVCPRPLEASDRASESSGRERRCAGLRIGGIGDAWAERGVMRAWSQALLLSEQDSIEWDAQYFGRDESLRRAAAHLRDGSWNRE